MGSVKGTTQNPPVVFCDDGGRPEVDKYDNPPTFRPNDYVLITNPPREGRFKVKDVRDGKCTLLDRNGRSVDGGIWFEESSLELEEEDAFN